MELRVPKCNQKFPMKKSVIVGVHKGCVNIKLLAIFYQNSDFFDTIFCHNSEFFWIFSVKTPKFLLNKYLVGKLYTNRDFPNDVPLN